MSSATAQKADFMPAPDPVRGALRDFYDDYAAALDAGEFEAWPGFFTDDAKYSVVARENFDQGLSIATIYCEGIGMIKDRVWALRNTTVYEPRAVRHFVSGLRIRSAVAGTIVAEANFAMFESIEHYESRLILVGRYLDKVVVEKNGFRFKERVCVYDNYSVAATLVTPV